MLDIPVSKADEGGDAVASLTDDNAVLAGIASAHYCDIDAALPGAAGRRGNGRKKRGTQTGGGTFFLSVPGGMLVKNIIKGII